MRTLYSVIFYLLIPFILLRLLWRSIKVPAYRERWRERFAVYGKRFPEGVIWFHAVSVGEAEALFPLVFKLQQQFPQSRFLITTTTPTGSARVQAVLGKSVAHVYLPYDTPDIVRRFMHTFKPVLAVVMETELWPNLFEYCGNNGIPLHVINARLSEKSARGYLKVPALIRPMLANVKHIAAQSQEDADRFIAIGAEAEQVSVVGNIKFDLEIQKEMIEEGKRLKTEEFQNRYICLAASTHQGEEQILLNVYKELQAKIPELLLLIVPRHPERFIEVAELCKQNKLVLVTRSSSQKCTFATDVYLADTMGELKMLYAAADVAFIGGSLVPVGGHNLLEAAAIGVPVLFGPYMANFKEIANKVLVHKAAVQCRDQESLIKAIELIYADADYRNLLIENGRLFVQSNRGVNEKLCGMLATEI